MLLVSITFGLSLCLFAICALLAPEGWEDEGGFHYGIQPPDKRR